MDEKKASEEYLDLLERMKSEPCCLALISKISNDEKSHYDALNKIEAYICVEEKK